MGELKPIRAWGGGVGSGSIPLRPWYSLSNVLSDIISVVFTSTFYNSMLRVCSVHLFDTKQQKKDIPKVDVYSRPTHCVHFLKSLYVSSLQCSLFSRIASKEILFGGKLSATFLHVPCRIQRSLRDFCPVILGDDSPKVNKRIIPSQTNGTFLRITLVPQGEIRRPQWLREMIRRKKHHD